MTQIASYDHVGHIEYPDDEKITNLVFYKNPMRTKWVVKRGNCIISTRNYNRGFVKFLSSVGYKTEQITLPATNAHRSIPVISIPCNNEHCSYHDECYKGQCKINIKATMENITDGYGVLVSFKARDIEEFVVKRKCIVRHIKELTGIEGNADAYGKMELC